MLITDYEPQLGLEVGFLMSYLVLGPEINEKYARIWNIKKIEKSKEKEEYNNESYSS